MNAPMELTPEQKKKQRQRNLALAAVLFAFVFLIYWVTVIKLGANVLNRSL